MLPFAAGATNLRLYHVIPNVLSSEDMEEKIEYVLDKRNHPELDRVRKRGQALVWDTHMTADRAKLIDDACTGGA